MRSLCSGALAGLVAWRVRLHPWSSHLLGSPPVPADWVLDRPCMPTIRSWQLPHCESFASEFGCSNFNFRKGCLVKMFDYLLVSSLRDWIHGHGIRVWFSWVSLGGIPLGFLYIEVFFYVVCILCWAHWIGLWDFLHGFGLKYSLSRIGLQIQQKAFSFRKEPQVKQ